MKFDEKKEFLEFAKDLARNLEEKTTDFIEIKIGWMEDWHNGYCLPVTIMVNHETAWFGSFEELGWNENVLFNNIKHFVPEDDDYLVLNELIDKAYGGAV